ncbi:helix-turn-helix domain-containing protein [Nocardia sp. NPDC052278]|uniref:helix-turn-helix domain-containing protein n=1 Tax=unclassified Nocardia TaxID=2637762 RepID=UPI00368DD893
MHGQPSHSWTVAELADQAGLSRATFARRFATLIGQPVIAYLTWRRMTLAARKLRETDIPLGGSPAMPGTHRNTHSHTPSNTNSVAHPDNSAGTRQEHRTGRPPPPSCCPVAKPRDTKWLAQLELYPEAAVGRPPAHRRRPLPMPEDEAAFSIGRGSACLCWTRRSSPAHRTLRGMNTTRVSV